MVGFAKSDKSDEEKVPMIDDASPPNYVTGGSGLGTAPAWEEKPPVIDDDEPPVYNVGSEKQTITSHTASDPADHDHNHSPSFPPGREFHIYRQRGHDFSIRLADKKTVAYWVGRQGSIRQDNSMSIRVGDANGPPIAHITAHTSLLSKEKDKLNVQWLGTAVDGPEVAGGGGKAKTMHIQRDTNFLGRRFRVQLPDGQTCSIQGATSKTVLAYWGDLKMEDDLGQVVADFRCLAWKSLDKIGTITLHGNPGSARVEEIVLAILAVAHREYRLASQAMIATPGIW